MLSNYKIRTSFRVYGTLTVEAENFSEALEKLQDKEIFTSYGLGSPLTYGFNEDIMDREGITVDEEDYDSDPSPTGYQQTTRQWEWDTDDEEED